MKPVLYAHPFASYCWKVLVALYENQTAFTYRSLGPEDPEAFTELEALWPLKKFPVLLDQGRPVIESSVIIEHLMRMRRGHSANSFLLERRIVTDTFRLKDYASR